jgi:hypothetical protein
VTVDCNDNQTCSSASGAGLTFSIDVIKLPSLGPGIDLDVVLLISLLLLLLAGVLLAWLLCCAFL